MDQEVLKLSAQVTKNDNSYFILYDTNKRQYFTIIQNNDIQVPQKLLYVQENEPVPISIFQFLEFSSINPNIITKDQNDKNQYSLVSLFDLFSPLESSSFLNNDQNSPNIPSQLKNKIELKFTPGEYAKAIYGISQALCFASKHGLSVSLSDIFFDNDKLPHIAFCTPLFKQSQKSISTSSNELNNKFDDYVYSPEETKIAFGHILYLLALLTFDDKNGKEVQNDDDNFFFNDDDDDVGIETEDGEKIELEAEVEEIKQVDDENNEVIIEQEKEYVNLDENNDGNHNDDNNNDGQNQNGNNNDNLNENEEQSNNKKTIFNRQKIFHIFRLAHHIISPPFELFPSFIDELFDRCMCPTVPFEWIIGQISTNIEFIIEHGEDAEKVIDDPKTQSAIRSFKQYTNEFESNNNSSSNDQNTEAATSNGIDMDDIPLRPPAAAPGTFRSFVIQEDLPYKMDPWIYCQTQSIIDLQAILMDTTEDTLEENISIFLDSIYRHDMQLIDSFVHYIIIAVFHRPKCIKTICLLVKGIIDSCLNNKKENDDGEKYVSRLKEAILRMTPEKPASSGHYANACGPLNFLYECHKIGIFNDDEIYKLIRNLTSLKDQNNDQSDPSQYDNEKFGVRRVGAHLAAYFAPLLDRVDFNLLQAITNHVVKYREDFPKVYYSTFNVIMDIITQEQQERAILNQSNQDLSRENWIILEKMIYNENGIREILQQDKIESLREMAANPNFDINQRINPSLFDPYFMAADKPTILEYAAFHSAIKCFRYLLLNGADTELKDSIDRAVVHYAIDGGSIEIVRICEQERLNFDGALEESVKMYQFDIFEWLQGTKYQVLPMNNLTYGSIPVNAARTNNIRMILFSLENGLDINISDQHDSFPLLLASLFGYNDVIRLLLTSPKIEVNKQDTQGNTSLIIAIDEGYVDTVKLLLSHRDVDVLVTNNHGVSCLFFLIFLLFITLQFKEKLKLFVFY